MQAQRRFKQGTALETRLDDEAKRLRDEACQLPPGAERESLMRKAREVEVTSEMVNWINSPTSAKFACSDDQHREGASHPNNSANWMLIRRSHDRSARKKPRQPEKRKLTRLSVL
jgi:hypothetical protein